MDRRLTVWTYALGGARCGVLTDNTADDGPVDAGADGVAQVGSGRTTHPQRNGSLGPWGGEHAFRAYLLAVFSEGAEKPAGFCHVYKAYFEAVTRA